MLDALERAGTALGTVAALAAYLERWRWPRQRACGAERVFEGDSISAIASQTLGCMQLIGRHFEDVVAREGLCTAEIRSFCACCDAVENRNAASIRVATPAEVAVARWSSSVCTRRHTTIHCGCSNTTLASHVPTMHERAGRLLSCWVHERKHSLIKQFVKDHHFTGGYERSLMLSSTAQHIAGFVHGAAQRGCRTCGPRPPTWWNPSRIIVLRRGAPISVCVVHLIWEPSSCAVAWSFSTRPGAGLQPRWGSTSRPATGLLCIYICLHAMCTFLYSHVI